MFQSIFAQSGRWNERVINPITLEKCTFQSIFAQSGRWNHIKKIKLSDLDLFQSIFAQSGRWNETKPCILRDYPSVSIHLCPKRALEYEYFEAMRNSEGVGFNPSLPKAGVGIDFIIVGNQRGVGVSIHLCPKRALEFGGNGIVTIIFYVSIHLCPKRALEF